MSDYKKDFTREECQEWLNNAGRALRYLDSTFRETSWLIPEESRLALAAILDTSKSLEELFDRMHEANEVLKLVEKDVIPSTKHRNDRN